MVLDAEAFAAIYGPEFLADLSARANLLAPPLTAAQLADHAAALREAEVIFSGWGAPLMDASFLARAPRLRAVFYGAGTIRYFTTGAFWARGIAISSAYAANAIPTAEFALASILLSLKHGWRYALAIKRRAGPVPVEWMPGAYGSKVGLLSLGTVGRLVLQRLRAFDLELLAYDPFVSPERAAQLGVRLVSLTELFRQCDAVSVHTPLLPETTGLIGAEHFKLMKSGATFLNTARGEIVREQELIEVFAERPDLTAVLDVTATEPPAAGSPLYTLPNIILTPHIAGSRSNECRRMGRAMLEEYDRWVRGEPLSWAVTPELLYQLA